MKYNKRKHTILMTEAEANALVSAWSAWRNYIRHDVYQEVYEEHVCFSDMIFAIEQVDPEAAYEIHFIEKTGSDLYATLHGYK